MGTNYYARIIPKHERKEKLLEAVRSDRFKDVMELSKELYGDSDEYEVRGVVHLGKRSGGWKFLWNPNVREVYGGHRDPKTNRWVEEITYNFLYPLTREGIREFVSRPDVVIVSEYYCDGEPCSDPKDDNPTAEQFLEMAFGWGAKDGYDALTYHKERPEERVYYCHEKDTFWRNLGYETNYGHDFYSDGLRFSTSVVFG